MGLWSQWMGAPSKVPEHVPGPDRTRELVLFKYDLCGYCRRVMQAAERLEVDLPTRDTREESSARTELLDRTGRTQVPCLFIDGEPLHESADIVAWLTAYAERSPGDEA